MVKPAVRQHGSTCAYAWSFACCDVHHVNARAYTTGTPITIFHILVFTGLEAADCDHALAQHCNLLDIASMHSHIYTGLSSRCHGRCKLEHSTKQVDP